MIFRKKKPDYDHIARLEREIAEMDTLDLEVQRAVEAKQANRREFFTPPILQKHTTYHPLFSAHAVSSHHAVPALKVALPPGVSVSQREIKRLHRTLNPRPTRG